jgi:hypothetical protein
VDTTPGYPRPESAGVDEAKKHIISAFESVPPTAYIFAETLIRAVLANHKSVSAAMWAIHELCDAGSLYPHLLKNIGANETVIRTSDKPAGLVLVDGKLRLVGQPNNWEEVVVIADHAKLAQKLKAPEPAAKSRPRNTESKRPGRRLSATERAVLVIIKSQRHGHGIRSKEIIAKLKTDGIEIANSSLRKHILPILKKHHGVINHRAAGGYMISRE